MNDSVTFLKQHKLKPYSFLKDDTETPIVFAWMPAVAIFFNDPDGHYLKFISVLEGEARPELEVVTYEEWITSKTLNSYSAS